MPDIHIGKSIYNEKKDRVNVELFFHVPNSKANNAYPGLTESLDLAGNPLPVSLAPGVTAQELTSLKNGTLIEVPKTVIYDLADGQNAIKLAAKQLWQGIADDEQARVDKDYGFYGTTLAKAT
jgi:hypothetical protein